MRILFLCPYPPYPPHGGGTMRIYQLIRGLAVRHDLTCLTFVPDLAAEQAMAPLCAICRVVGVHGPLARSLRQRAWTTLASRLPDMALRNADSGYTRALAALLQSEHFDIIQAESIEMAGYLLAAGQVPGTRSLHILDQFNAEYVLQKRAAFMSLRAAVGRTRQPLKSRAVQLAGGIYSLVQWLKLAAYERNVMRRCDALAAVSEDDRQALLVLTPAVNIGVVPNGVDTDYFRRTALEGGSADLGNPALVFSGTLDYRPNIDALEWFVAEVLPLIRARRPATRLIAVGRRPAPALRRLEAQGLLTLTGEVPDARPYIAGASAYVVPMRIGGGVRLKLLEALALETPVVSTTMGAEGVAGLRGGEHCLLADDPSGFAEATLRLLADPVLGRKLGESGRILARAGYDWSVIVPRMEALYRG